MKKKVNEARACFIEDVRDRKQLAHAARGRINGSRSKKCTLPSDYLTPAQRKKLNGKVETYRMNIPMTYKDFKELRPEYQERYLQGLMDTYGVGVKRIAEMFGITAAPLHKYISAHLPTLKTPGVGTKMNKDQREKWDEFLSYGKDQKSEESRAQIVEKLVPEVKPASIPMSISNLSIGYDGDINLDEVVTYLSLALGDKFTGHLQITFTKE